MRLETVKSFILAILIGSSLLLSFTLWSYKPDIERFTDDLVEDSTDLGGDEQDIKELIKPESIVFRNNGQYFGFQDPNDQLALYEDMQSWVMSDFRTSESQTPPSKDYQVELVFPDAIPMAMTEDLFTLNGQVNLPEWGFDHLFINFSQDSNALNVTFLSEDGDKQASATVNDSEKHDQLWEKLTTYDELQKVKRVDEAKQTFYIPAGDVDLAAESVAVKNIDAIDMVDVMFTNPDIVSRNWVSSNEIYFTDSVRGIMRVYPKRRTMEFENPSESSYEQMQSDELISESLSHINDHLGWTDNYYLMSLDIQGGNKIRYRLSYDNYPVFGDHYATVIEQQYRDDELYKYKRPLYNLANFLGEEEATTLRSGREVLDQLKESSSYDMAAVDDMTIGYQLTYHSDSNSIRLEPAWFVSENGNWREINFDDLD